MNVFPGDLSSIPAKTATLVAGNVSAAKPVHTLSFNLDKH